MLFAIIQRYYLNVVLFTTIPCYLFKCSVIYYCTADFLSTFKLSSNIKIETIIDKRFKLFLSLVLLLIS